MGKISSLLKGGIAGLIGILGVSVSDGQANVTQQLPSEKVPLILSHASTFQPKALINNTDHVANTLIAGHWSHYSHGSHYSHSSHESHSSHYSHYSGN